jgi:hypothetical protein
LHCAFNGEKKQQALLGFLLQQFFFFFFCSYLCDHQLAQESFFVFFSLFARFQANKQKKMQSFAFSKHTDRKINRKEEEKKKAFNPKKKSVLMCVFVALPFTANA